MYLKRHRKVNYLHLCRIAGPTCASIASKMLKGRPATVKKACDVSLAFVEWEQVEAVQVAFLPSFQSSLFWSCAQGLAGLGQNRVRAEPTLYLQEALFKAFGDKGPKAVVAALDILTQAFRSALTSRSSVESVVTVSSSVCS